MKKLLITSTALVVASSAAFADGHTGVSLSGFAEMGITGGDTSTTDQFWTDVGVSFKMSGETDGGLTFGTSIALEDGAKADANKTGDGDVAVFISGDFGTLTLGDTDGAFDKAFTSATETGVGALRDESTSHGGALNNGLDGIYDGQILRYDYSFADLTLSLSTELDDTDAQDDGYGIGIKYTTDLGGTSLTLGAGYQAATFTAGSTFANGDSSFTVTAGSIPAGTDLEHVGISAGIGIAGFDVTLAYQSLDIDGVGNVDHTSVGFTYTIDAFSFGANLGQYRPDASTGLADVDGYGISAKYDLGGGASAHLGYKSSDASGDDVDQYSLGLAFGF